MCGDSNDRCEITTDLVIRPQSVNLVYKHAPSKSQLTNLSDFLYVSEGEFV